MKLKIFGGLLVAILAITSAAQAQTHTPVINRHERHEVRRINQGVRHGSLTHREATHLRRDEQHIRNEKRLAMRDGRITARERQNIRQAERHTSRDIYRAKHNRRHF